MLFYDDEDKKSLISSIRDKVRALALFNDKDDIAELNELVDDLFDKMHE